MQWKRKQNLYWEVKEQRTKNREGMFCKQKIETKWKKNNRKKVKSYDKKMILIVIDLQLYDGEKVTENVLHGKWYFVTARLHEQRRVS